MRVGAGAGIGFPPALLGAWPIGERDGETRWCVMTVASLAWASKPRASRRRSRVAVQTRAPHAVLLQSRS